MPEFREIIIAIVGGIASAICTGGPLTAIFLYYRNRTDASIRTLKEDLKHLREEQIKKIETKVECHIEQDQAQKILTEIKNLAAKVELMSNKLDNTREENSEQRANIKNNFNYIENVNKSLQDHKRDHGKK